MNCKLWSQQINTTWNFVENTTFIVQKKTLTLQNTQHLIVVMTYLFSLKKKHHNYTTENTHACGHSMLWSSSSLDQQIDSLTLTVFTVEM